MLKFIIFNVVGEQCVLWVVCEKFGVWKYGKLSRNFKEIFCYNFQTGIDKFVTERFSQKQKGFSTSSKLFLTKLFHCSLPQQIGNFQTSFFSLCYQISRPVDES